jgi:hypothetical protein
MASFILDSIFCGIFWSFGFRLLGVLMKEILSELLDEKDS